MPISALPASRRRGFFCLPVDQRGKSYLLSTLFKRHLLKSGVTREHIVEINLEDKKSAVLRNPEKMHEHILERLPKDGEWTYVFIDEIQFYRKALLPGVSLKDVLPEDRDTVRRQDIQRPVPETRRPLQRILRRRTCCACNSSMPGRRAAFEARKFAPFVHKAMPIAEAVDGFRWTTMTRHLNYTFENR